MDKKRRSPTYKFLKVNTPSAKAEGFSMDKISPIPRTFTLSHTQCVARASRDWLPRLSIPRAKFNGAFKEQVLACTKVEIC